jgi:hypothetical protein
MSHAASEHPLGPAATAADLPLLCQDVFSSLARSDQRRWGEIYVRGLLTTPGRKSIRNISDHVVGWRADQCLQQFVNQSPWECEPVRRALARLVASALQPQAWVVKEVIFPKNGSSSVGVARQYAHSAGRVLNCQIGIAVFLVGAGGSCPVNWRLLLPRSWDADPGRRRRAHLPDHERHLPRWQPLLDAIDEMTADWGLPRVPVIADLREEPRVDPVLRGLEERRISYVLRVAESRPAVTVHSAGSPPRTLSLGEVAGEPARPGTITLSGAHDSPSRPGRSHLMAKPLPSGPRPGCGPRAAAPRYVVTEWPLRRRRPPATWLTSLESHRLADLPDQFALHEQVAADMARLNDALGLRHFEGRSFRGWHHHVTLVSIAHASQLLARLQPAGYAPGRLGPLAAGVGALA